MNHAFLWPFLVLMLAASAFFSFSEMVYTHCTTLRLRTRAEKGGRHARAAVKVSENFENTLIAILLGNNLANIAASSAATVLVIALLGPGYSWVATAAMTLIVLIFAEITPKQLALRIPEKGCAVTAIPLRLLTWIFFPFEWLVAGIGRLFRRARRDKTPDPPTVTEEELETIIDNVEDEGLIDEETGDLLQSALDFREVQVYEILTPRVDMTWLDLEDPYEENRRIIEESPFTRLPVGQGSPDKIVGILHLNRYYKALLQQEKPDLTSLLLPVTFVHKTMTLPDAFEVMRKNLCHMVVVTDEYGGTMGILTMEDILEQIVGDIWDESDEVEEEFVFLNDHTALVSGDMRIYDFFDEVEVDDRDYDDDNATVGGWVIDRLEGEAAPGKSFTYKNLTVTVLETEGQRVTRVRVEIAPPEEEEE